jgi:hypothetical protein
MVAVPPEPASIEARVQSELRPGETLSGVLPGLGASLAVSSQRVFIFRHGGSHRPKSGLRIWDLAAIRGTSADQPRRGQGQVILRTGAYPWQAVSIFYAGPQWPLAKRLVGVIERATEH